MALTPRQVANAPERRDRLVALAKHLPEVDISPAGKGGHLAFKVRKKPFAYYERDHHGDGKIALCAKSTHAEQQRRVRDDPWTWYVPAYLGAQGWVALRLDLDEVGWAEVSALLRAAYLARAPKTLAAQVK